MVRNTPWHWGGIDRKASHTASLQNRNGSYRVFFEYQRKQRVFTIGRVSEAEAKADQVDYLLMRLSQGLLALRSDGDIVAFVRHDGLIPQPAPVMRGEPTLADLRDRYIETHEASLEHHTVRGVRRHFRHQCRLLGDGFPIRKLSLADLQGYVEKRSKARGAQRSAYAGHNQEGDRHAPNCVELGRADEDRFRAIPVRWPEISEVR